ncbi:MAG TPA: hypothetical protein VFN24_09620 [Microbacterium sp.]|nr:hypothetical protein [Microbacterium sp.]
MNDAAAVTPRGADGAERQTGSRDDALLTALTRALRTLGEAGETDAASRIAARAWSEIRRTDPAGAERLNGTLHYLARLPGPSPAHRAASRPETDREESHDG